MQATATRSLIVLVLALTAPSLQAATAASDIPLRDYVHTVTIRRRALGGSWITQTGDLLADHHTEGLLRLTVPLRLAVHRTTRAAARAARRFGPFAVTAYSTPADQFIASTDIHRHRSMLCGFWIRGRGSLKSRSGISGGMGRRSRVPQPLRSSPASTILKGAVIV